MRTRRRWAVTIVAGAVAIGGCATDDTATTAAPDARTTTADTAGATSAVPPSAAGVTSATMPSPSAPVVTPVGVGRTAARAVAADGTECELCLWVADTPSTRRRGLMEVTDLGGADGMVFVYATPRTGTFWMKDTVLPLSIAFFDASGTYLDAFDMEPCPDDRCPNYPTPTDFTSAVEVEQGRLTELGLGPGSTLELLDLACTD